MANRRKGSSSRSHFRIDDLHVQPERNVVIRGAEEIKLERRMMEVLEYLAQHAGETVGTGTLLVELWGSEVYGDNPVNKTVSLLRKLIGDNARNPRYIQTINKVGYRMIATVSMPEDYRRLPTKRWANGSPYVGLTAFDARHAPVYCGRGRIVADLLRAMRSQIDSQRRFVMLIGASGCGKTSLLHAGAIPLLTKPDGYEGLRTLSIAACDLAAAPAHDPLTPLIEAIARWTLDDGGTDGGRLVFPPQTTEQLKSLLAEQPSRIQDFVTEAFRRHPDRSLGEQPCAHLLLTIDHAETLVASADIDTKVREAFEHLVLALCDCPHVLVVMIARSDFYPKLIETLPALAERKAGDGHLDVLPPRYGEIAEIIRTPAWKANLGFEVDPDSRDRLDDVLRDTAVAQPVALPLLQHTLQTLYERRSNNGTLTFSAYNDIGGLEGAIAHRAEQVFATLSTHVQASLNTVLARLIVIHPDSDAVSARRTFIDALPAEARALVDAFTSARLFVGDHSDGGATVGVAHEALLRRWPRAVEWTNENRRLLNAKTRLQRATARWIEEGRQDDHLLNPGRPLGEAQEASKRFPDDLSIHDLALLHASERAYRHKQTLRRAATMALILLTTVSTGLAILAMSARNSAELHRKEAISHVGYLLVELADQLRPTASTRTLDSISTYTLKLLERQPVEDMETEDLINYSRALRTRGEVISMQGKNDEAMSLFKHANDMALRANQRETNLVPALFEAGQTAYWIGFQFRKQNDHKNAKTAWLSYLHRSEEILSIDETNPDSKMEVLLASTNLGTLDLLESGCGTALGKLESSLAEMSPLIKSGREKALWKYHWIVSRSWVTRCHAEDGRVDKALKGFSSEIEDLRALLDKNPDATEWMHQLSSLLQFGTMQSVNAGRLDNAEEYIAEAIELLRIVTRLHPENVTWKRNLASALARGGEVADLRGDPATAIVRLRASLMIIDQQRPKGLGANWLRLDAATRFRIGRLQATTEGENIMTVAIADLDALSKRNADDYTASAMSAALVSRGLLRRDQGRIDQARNDWQAAKSMLDTVAKRSRDPDILTPWISACLLLGQRAPADKLISHLVASGYRHPEFVPINITQKGTPLQ